ncbi:MAG: phosphatidate cytidylyltransferase [Methylobacillus sp.]|jgi:phosphatidate cytidylyltransferase|nr:phosphatidate cytidylyltransferase [Methylobacillus sp.]
MLKQRVLTAVALLAGFLAALFYLPEPYWALLMLGVICLAALEWGALIGLKRSGAWLLVVVVGFGVAAMMWDFPELDNELDDGIPRWLTMGIFILSAGIGIFWMVAVPLWLKLRFRIENKFFLAIVGLMVLFPTWMAASLLPATWSPFFLLAVMAIVWIADIAAYFVGKRFGRHKLAPSISPGKTWEGVIGALCAVALYGVILCLTLHLSFWLIPGFLVLTIMSVVGDLFESLLKRQAGIKDSGNLLPGHGGVLDRIDGLTAVLPLSLFVFLPVYHRLDLL